VQKSAARDLADRDFPIVVATMPINAWQRTAALGVAILLLLGAAIEAPFAHIQAIRIDGFIPVVQTVIFVADLITAMLLFAQYAVQPRPALPVLAAGYIASGSFSFLQTLAFPGSYAPSGLIGDGIDSPAWLFVWWQTTFPLAILVYAVMKDVPHSPGKSDRFTGVAIGLAVASALALISGLTLLATAGAKYLPALYTGGVMQQTLFANHINLFMWLWGAIALLVLFFRRRTILDLWLMVTLFAWMPNFLIAATTTAVRFSVGWYSARGYALIASCIVLVVLLTETTVLHARLVSAVTLLRRERSNRLMSLDAATAAMAHELRQPLTAITMTSSAASQWLEKSPPNLDEMRVCLFSIAESSRRAEEIIAGVRELFKKSADHRTMIYLDDVTRQVLKLVEHDLLLHEVSLATDFQTDLPEVHADRIQIQQVILNLVRNAIDAMDSTAPNARKLRLATSFNGDSSVSVSVQDTGRGISAEQSERVFEPFFTTKPSGMGLGLAICQTIVQDHGGILRLAKTGLDGSIFEIALPSRQPHGDTEKHS
jgi:signal transduction histidine kinase